VLLRLLRVSTSVVESMHWHIHDYWACLWAAIFPPDRAFVTIDRTVQLPSLLSASGSSPLVIH
jgi:hypothetical protein